MRSDNTSGRKGVSKIKSGKNAGKWRAQLVYKSRYVVDRKFNTFEEAVMCREEAERKYLKKK